MKKIVLIVLILFSLIIFVGCEKDFEVYDRLILKEFVEKDDIDSITFYDCVGYHKDKKFFYEVRYEKGDNYYEVLFICNKEKIDSVYNMSGISALMTDNPLLYFDYCDAKEDGELHIMDKYLISEILEEIEGD